MGLRDIESSLPPGFRFYPSDEELVGHYLYKKVANERVSGGTMVEVDLHEREPWQLPDVAKLSGHEWYFFSFRDRKYATGSRANRATKTGYWKATGKDRTVYHPATQAIIGMRKTLVFYLGRAPNGTKTGWVMHEFRLETPHTPPKEDWVLCRVFHKRKSEHEQDNNVSCQYSPTPGSSPPHMEQLPLTDSFYNQMGSSIINTTTIQEDNNGSNTFFNLQALMQCDFLEESTPMVGVGSRGGDDEYGFLFDVEDHVMDEGGELRFPMWQG